MTNNIDNAIARLQAIALQCTSTTIKAAPNYPAEDAMVLPLSIAYLASGSVSADNATDTRILPTINVDFHFSRLSMKNAYTQIDAIAQEFSQRLGGDPTLNGTVSTIVFPVTFSTGPTQWDKVITQMLRFVVPVKILQTPTAST